MRSQKWTAAAALFGLASASSSARAGDSFAHNVAAAAAATYVAAEFPNGVGAPNVGIGEFQIPTDCVTNAHVNDPDFWQCSDPNAPPDINDYNDRAVSAAARGIASWKEDCGSMLCNYSHFVNNAALSPGAGANTAAAQSATLDWAILLLDSIQLDYAYYCNLPTWSIYWSRVLNAIHFAQDAATVEHAIGNEVCDQGDLVAKFNGTGLQFQFGPSAACTRYLDAQLQQNADGNLACDDEIGTTAPIRTTVLDNTCFVGRSAAACMGLERTIRHHCYTGGNVRCAGGPSNHCAGGDIPPSLIPSVCQSQIASWDTVSNSSYCEGEICVGGDGQNFVAKATSVSIPIMEMMAQKWEMVCQQPSIPCVQSECSTWCDRSVRQQGACQVNSNGECACQCGADAGPGTCSVPTPPTTVAVAIGDPHLLTFDREHYDCQVWGETTLCLSPVGDLEVQVRTHQLGTENVAVIRGVAARIATDRVAIYLDGGTTENGDPISFPTGAMTQLDGGGKVWKTASGYLIAWPDGSQLRVTLNGIYMGVQLNIADSRMDSGVTGLLGNANGDAGDDLTPRGGGLALTSPATFEEFYGDGGYYSGYAGSWRVAQDASLFDYADGESTQSPDITNLNFPVQPQTAQDLIGSQVQSATAICEDAGVPMASGWMDDCVLDVALSGNSAAASAFLGLPLPLASLDVQRSAGSGDGGPGGAGPGALDGVEVTRSIRCCTAPPSTAPVDTSSSMLFVGSEVQFPYVASNGSGMTPIASSASVTSNQIEMDYPADASTNAAAFHGSVFTFSKPADGGVQPPMIANATLDSLTTVSGVTVTFDAEDVFVNVAGLMIPAASKIVVDLTFAP